jgi:hypothetical protein
VVGGPAAGRGGRAGRGKTRRSEVVDGRW